MFVSPMFLLRVILCVHFVAARDAETRRAQQQQRRNAAASAAAALQARHEETIRLTGEYKVKCLTSNFLSKELLFYAKKKRYWFSFFALFRLYLQRYAVW